MDQLIKFDCLRNQDFQTAETIFLINKESIDYGLSN